MEETNQWSVKHTVLLGDACHPVLPFGFSGASMAIEDATTLGELFPEDVSVSQIPERLKLYEEIRKPRVGRVREVSRIVGREGKPPKGYFEFLAEHDVIKIAREALEQQTREK